MSTEVDTVHAHEDPDRGGAWATCPHCGEDKGVTWSGPQQCNQCQGEFILAAGPLVKDPQNLEIEVFSGPDGILFYNDHKVSFP